MLNESWTEKYRKEGHFSRQIMNEKVLIYVKKFILFDKMC
jgi:hypothetical protein